MVQDPSFGAFPLIQSEGDEHQDPDDDGRQHASVGPCIKSTSEPGASEEEREACSEKSATNEVNVAEFTPEGQML